MSPDCPWLMHGAWTTAIPTRADYAAELAKTQRLLAAERQDLLRRLLDDVEAA